MADQTENIGTVEEKAPDTTPTAQGDGDQGTNAPAEEAPTGD